MIYERSWMRIVIEFSICLLSVLTAGAFVGVTAATLSDPGSAGCLAAYVFVTIIVAGNLSIWIWGIVWTAMRRKSFRCSVTESMVDCQCPIPWFGQSFSVPISDLASIRIEATSGDGYRCVLVTKHGTEYDLTYWYGNPVDRIVGEILRVCPTIQRSGFGRETRSSNCRTNG